MAAAKRDLVHSQRFLIELQFEYKVKSVHYVSGNISNSVTLKWLEMSSVTSVTVVHHPLDPSVTRCLVNAGIPGGV